MAGKGHMSVTFWNFPLAPVYQYLFRILNTLYMPHALLLSMLLCTLLSLNEYTIAFLLLLLEVIGEFWALFKLII